MWSLLVSAPLQVSNPTLEEAIRGFRVVRNETQELVFNKPGDYLVPEAAVPQAAAEASEHWGSETHDAELDLAGAAAVAAAEAVETTAPALEERVSIGAGADILGS